MMMVSVKVLCMCVCLGQMKTTKCSQQVTDEALQHEHHKVRHIIKRGWAWTLSVVEWIICETNKQREHYRMRAA